MNLRQVPCTEKLELTRSGLLECDGDGVAGDTVRGEAQFDLRSWLYVCWDDDVHLVKAHESRSQARELHRSRLPADAGFQGCRDEGWRVARSRQHVQRRVAGRAP